MPSPSGAKPSNASHSVHLALGSPSHKRPSDKQSSSSHERGMGAHCPAPQTSPASHGLLDPLRHAHPLRPALHGAHTPDSQARPCSHVPSSKHEQPSRPGKHASHRCSLVQSAPSPHASVPSQGQPTSPAVHPGSAQTPSMHALPAAHDCPAPHGQSRLPTGQSWHSPLATTSCSAALAAQVEPKVQEPV